MNNVKLIIHIRDGKFYDITDMVTNITISGSTTSVARTLETEFLQSVTDERIKTIGLKTGSSVCFYENEIELFRGNVIDINNSSGSNIKLTIKDIGFTLGKAKLSKSYTDMKVEDIASDVLSTFKLKNGGMVSTGAKMTRFFRNTSAYDTIMTAYTYASKQNKKKYMININLDEVQVIERGQAIDIEFNADENMTGAEHDVSIENLVSTVQIYDDKGNKISEKVNQELYKIYRRMLNEIVEQGGKNQPADVDSLFHREDHTCKFSGFGNYNCRSGMKVKVRDKRTGLVGDFYIDSDKHTWSGGTYKIELDLNFENIMDEKDASSEKEKTEDGASSEGTKDWGHGVTAEQLNKVLKGKLAGTGEIFLKYCNMYKINPAVAAAIAMTETGNGTSKMATDGRNNFFGMRNKNGWMHFSSVEEGIRRGIANISKNYINKGLNSFEKMVGKYAEGGGSWVPACKNFFNKITGKSPGNFGTGVRTDAEAKSNIVYGVSSGTMSERQKIIVQSALSKKGSPYVWGAKGSSGFDCSGLAYWAHKQAGINVPGGSSGQLSGGKKVSPANIQPGDIIILSSKGSPSGRHVKMAIGNGLTIEAMDPRHGVVVRKMDLSGLKGIRRYW